MRTLVCTLAIASMATLSACDGDDNFVPLPDTDTDEDTDTDTDDDTDTDTEPCSPDEDGDGFCPPEDCDDTTIFVNPAWDEEPGNDIDDNCDGRIDEEFSRVLAFELDQNRGPAIVQVDTLGTFKGSFAPSEPAFVRVATLDRDLEHYIGWDGQRTVWRFDENAVFEKVAELPEEYEWLNEDEEPDPPPAIGGDIAMHPDGYYLVAAADRLLKFEDGGSWSVVAQWACLEEDESHEFCPLSVTVDTVTGDALLLGFFGGVGTWNETDGLTVITTSDPENPGPSYTIAQHEPMDSSYAMANFVNEAEEQSIGMFRWNAGAQEMRLLGEWPSEYVGVYTPNSFMIESETGDFYLSANSNSNGSGSWENQLWRWTADGSFATILYSTPNGENDQNTWFAGAVYYTQD